MKETRSGINRVTVVDENRFCSKINIKAFFLKLIRLWMFTTLCLLLFYFYFDFPPEFDRNIMTLLVILEPVTTAVAIFSLLFILEKEITIDEKGITLIKPIGGAKSVRWEEISTIEYKNLGSKTTTIIINAPHLKFSFVEMDGMRAIIEKYQHSLTDRPII